MKCKGEDMCDCNASCIESCNADAKHVKNDALVYLGEMPEWWNPQTGQMAVYGGALIITQPDQPPHRFSAETMKWEEVKLS